MAELFKVSETWVVDYRYDGKSRRRFKLLRTGSDARSAVAAELADLYGERAQLIDVRRATREEETDYLRGEEERNVLCPTGRAPNSSR